MPNIDYKKIYFSILRSQILDDELRAMYDNKVPMLRKNLYSGKGQHAAAAIAGLLRQDDYLFPHPYRGFTHMVAKGVPVEKIVGEYFGKETGMLKGFGDVGGFYYYPDRGIVGCSTVLGSNFAIVCGLAMAVKKSGSDKIVCIFFGDGEASRSTFGGALNLASIWQLPVLFVCENNGLSISTPVYKTSATPFISDRAKGYNVKSIIFDGSSVVQLLEQSYDMLNEVRIKQEPLLIEVLTPRFEGHAYSEKQFKGADRIRTTTGLDPLEVYEKELIERGLFDHNGISKAHKIIGDEIKKNVEESLAVPQSSKEDFFSYYHE